MNEYWHETFDELEEEKNRDAELFAAAVFVFFTDGLEQIEKYVTSWFGRYGKMTAQEARRSLSNKELLAFRSALKEFITDDVDTNWVKRLERLSSKVRISRVEMLETQLRHEVEKVYRKYSGGFDDFVIALYTDQHNHVLFEMAKGIGKTKVFDKVDMDKLRSLLGKSWAVDGKVYSDRIWSDKVKLVNEINNVIGKGLIRGDSAQQMSEEIARRMKVSYNNAERLVKTESAFISSEAERDAYKKFGVKRYEYIAIRDNRTSEICRYMDGRVFLVSEMKVGLNAPPLHCYCRSTTCPYFDEDDAIGEDDEFVLIDTGLTYDQWGRLFLK